jgi:hypothetical protein
MRVIHVPMSEMDWPPKNSLKLRCRSARHACETPLGWIDFAEFNSGDFSRGAFSSGVLTEWILNTFFDAARNGPLLLL